MIHSERNLKSSTVPLIPLAVGGLVEDVGCDVVDVLRVQAAAKSRHGVLPVGHLVHDGGLLETALEVLLKSVLAEGLLVLDDVVSAGMAGRTVAIEHSLSCLDVSGEDGGDGEKAGDEGGSGLRASGKHSTSSRDNSTLLALISTLELRKTRVERGWKATVTATRTARTARRNMVRRSLLTGCA